MAVIRNLVVKIAADISSLSKGLQSAQKSIQKVSAGFKKRRSNYFDLRFSYNSA